MIAGQPSGVPGILIIRLGWSTVFQRSAASATVASASWARPGETSIETRPSTASVASYTGRMTWQASRTSSVVITRTAWSRSVPTRGQLADLRVVALTLAERRLEDRRVGRHADDVGVLDEVGEVAGLEALAGQVVEPDGHSRVGELLQAVGHGSSCVGWCGWRRQSVARDAVAWRPRRRPPR